MLCPHCESELVRKSDVLYVGGYAKKIFADYWFCEKCQMFVSQARALMICGHTGKSLAGEGITHYCSECEREAQ